MQYVALTVVVAGAAAGLGWVVRAWYRNAPLRREMRTQAITFQTQLSWVKFSDREVRNPELIVRGGIFRVGAPFGLLPNLEYYFRAPETTIELSRNPLAIYGVETRQEWIVVRGSQAGRKIQLSMTTRYFLDDVWNATFHFVDADPVSGLDRARDAAQGKDVRLGGGVTTIRQFLDAGLVDTMHVAVSQVELGSGSRLWNHPMSCLTSSTSRSCPAERRDPPPVLAKVTRGGSGHHSGARCGHVSRRSATGRRCSWGSRVATVERMTIQRMEHVGIVVDDLAAATAFFVELGLKLQGEGPVEGGWVDRVVGLEGVRAEIAMVETPDGHGRLELTKFHAPPGRGGDRYAPANTPGIRHVAFAVDDIDAVVASLRARGAELVGKVERYEDSYRLCYVRGPEGIIVELAEQIG